MTTHQPSGVSAVTCLDPALTRAVTSTAAAQILPHYTQFKKVGSTPEFTATNVSQVQEEGLLLTLSFLTVVDYLFYLREACQSIAKLGNSAIAYLAAAVSDFYIPSSQVAKHKIQSRDGPLTISMQQVPKMLTKVVDHWCPEAFIISFKLETNEDLIGSKAKRALDLYHHQLVISNLLQTRKDVVNFVTPSETEAVKLSQEDKSAGLEIEVQMIRKVLELHKTFAAQ